MNCFNQWPGNDKIVVCRKAYNKNYYAKNREQILVRQKRYRTENAEILKSRRKRWYENNRERLASSQRAYCQQNKEHIRNYQRQYFDREKSGASLGLILREVTVPGCFGTNRKVYKCHPRPVTSLYILGCVLSANICFRNRRDHGKTSKLLASVTP